MRREQKLMKRPNIPGRIYVSGRDTWITGLGHFVRAWVCFVCVCVCGGGGEGKVKCIAGLSLRISSGSPQTLFACCQSDVSQLRSKRKEKKNLTGWHWHCLKCFRIGPICLKSGLLELWSFDEAVINRLTREDILEKINQEVIIRWISNLYKSSFHAHLYF